VQTFISVIFNVKKILLLTLFTVLISKSAILCGQTNNISTFENLTFSIHYESIKPIEVHKAILYYSALKNKPKKDSLVVNIGISDQLTDTIVVKTKWKFPLFVKLKLECTDINLKSNEFYYYPGIKQWSVLVSDTSLKVQSKRVQNFSNPYKPLVGIVLLIQSVVEMILALIMSQMIGWSRTIWVMVLTANIASFPIYLIGFSHIWMRELVVLASKAFVMSVIGYRKIKFYKIVIFAVILSIVSFGFKEILFIIMRIL